MTKFTKKHIIRVTLLVGTILSLFFVPWVLLWAWILPLPESIQAQADQAIKHGFDGIIIYVDQAGKPPEYYCAGWHNREKKIPARPDALFKLASISKLYTAVAITKLAADGRLSLNDMLTDYMPELAGRIEYADQITLRQMVQHRSGIPNFTDTKEYWVSPRETDQENLDLVLDMPANFSPGDNYEYCNTNYVLLSLIMDRVLGYDHFDFIRAEILEGLDLLNTFGSLSEVNIENVMSGYYVGYEGDIKHDEMGMLATAEDVGTFLRALNDGALFDKVEQDIYSSIYVYNHTGLIPGYQSIAKYHPDIDAVVVQFNNTANFEGYEWGLAEISYGRVMKILKKRKN